MLAFDEAKHEYRWNGEVKPSVTQILAPLQDYSMIAPDVLQRAQQLGVAVHKMTELYDQDDLDEDFLEIEMLGYLNGWKKFRADTRFVPETIEQRLYHKLYGFSGTSDRTGIISGRRAVIDLKKMFILGPVIGIQTAAYKELHTHHGANIEDRYALGLRPDGTYRLQQYKDPSDWPTFMSLLTIRNWKLKNGIKL